MSDAPLRPVVSHRVLHESGPFTVISQTIRGDDGVEHPRTSIRHPGAVIVLPILQTPTGPHVVLVRNERHAIDKWIDELPAGGIEPGEDPIVAAARELREESGYEAATIEPLGRFYTTPGLSNELMQAFVATGLTLVGQELDPGELLTVHPVPVGELFDRIDRGTLEAGTAMLVLLLARWKGWFSGEPWAKNGREHG